MHILQIFNEYRSRFNGEEQVVRQITGLLEDRGHSVENWVRSSQDIENSIVGKAKAFSGMTWSREAATAMRRKLSENRPDVVHAHNLYPLFSPSVLNECRLAGVPVVVSLHNQQLTCPKSDHLRNGSICEKCFGGKTWNCATNNCRDNILESLGYAIRSGLAHSRGWVRDNATIILGMTEFSRDRLVRAGYPSDKIRILPNSVSLPSETADPACGTYIAFAGRLSEEKGLRVLMEAAAQIPDVPIHLAGDGPLRDELEQNAPANVTLRGRIERAEMPDFYARSRGLVLPSTCFEMCPLTILEAMAIGLPVVASQTGGLGELVDDGVTGALVKRGESKPLAEALAAIWSDPAAARVQGAAGRQRAEEQFTESRFVDRLVGYYHEAIDRIAETASDANASVAEPAIS